MTDTETQVRPGERIAKVMARAGLCSRRDAEAWIEAGRVTVNGEVLTSPAFNVGPGDNVEVDGKPLKEPERTRLFFFHKPRGLVTTARDPEGRATIFDALPPDLPRVVTVGRLDINTEGLLLLTNDGGLARVLELPSTGWLRRYRVRAHGEVTQPQLDALADGVTVEGIHYAGIQAKFEREQGSNVWITMGLREGKNREIKRVLEHLGLAVTRLIRISFGPFELADLPEGEVAEVPTRVLRDQLGAKLARQAEADFDAPIEPRRPPPPVEIESRGERPMRRPGAPGAPEGRPRKGAPVDRAAAAEERAKRGERFETVRPKKRKHISILRAEARAEEAGPRKRIERTATADRKGREVKVEHVRTARPDAAAPAAPSTGFGPKRGRSFEPRAPRPDGERAERKPRSFAPRGDRPEGERPKRSFGADRGPRPEGGERKPRSFAPRGDRPEGERPKRSFGGDRGPRPEGGERKPRSFAPRGDRPEGERPKRSFGGDRGPRPEGGERKPRSFTPRGDRPEGEGPKRSFGAGRGPRPEGGERKPRSFAPRGDRPEGEGPKRSFGGDRGPRPEGGERKPRSFAPRGDRPEGEGPKRSFGGDRGPRPEGGERKPRSFAPRGDRPEGERPKRSFGADRGPRPEGGERKPRSFKPGGGGPDRKPGGKGGRPPRKG